MSAIRKQVARSNSDLNQQDRTKIVRSEDGEDRGQECGISRQPGKGRHDRAGIGNAVDAVMEPVFGDVGVKAGVVHDGRKAEDAQEPQAERGETRPR